MSTDIALKFRNPYLEAFDKYIVKDEQPDGWKTWEPRISVSPNEYRSYKGPAWDRYMDETSNAYTARFHLTTRCTYAVPNTEAIMAIAELQMPVVEIGAGNGYWAWMLEQAGVDVVAFDTAIYDKDNHWCKCDHWTKVLFGGHERLPERSDHALILCWPTYSDPMAIDCLHAYSGDHLIYIGESEGGCCADDEFFSVLENKWEMVREIEIPQWPGLHDSLTIYRRLQT